MQVHMEADPPNYFNIKSCLITYYVPTFILRFMIHRICNKTPSLYHNQQGLRKSGLSCPLTSALNTLSLAFHTPTSPGFFQNLGHFEHLFMLGHCTPHIPVSLFACLLKKSSLDHTVCTLPLSLNTRTLF